MPGDPFERKQERAHETWKADAGRPVDIEMLDAFCDAYEDRLQSYGRMLQAVVAIATDQREPDAWRRREAEADRHVEEMKAKLPLKNRWARCSPSWPNCGRIAAAKRASAT
jgi:polyhydroxyalkanoate synthesis regulator protein